jgi:hypothetical protein
MHILNEFDEVGESLSNSKIVDKIFRVMMRRPRWESMISTLEAMQGTLGEFTNEEVFVGFWSNQIMLRLKLRKDRKIKILLLLKIGIKVCQMITERYIHFNSL